MLKSNRLHWFLVLMAITGCIAFVGFLVLRSSVAESADDRIANYTLWLTILNAGLFFAAIFQGRILIKSDDIARISADAAKSSVETMKDTAERQLRAYMGIPDWRGYPIQNNRLILDINYRNFGQTPAYKVHKEVVTSIRSKDDNIIRPIPTDSTDNYTDNYIVLQPSQAMSCRGKIDLLEGESEHINSGDQIIHCQFTWFYVDAFGKNRKTRVTLINSGNLSSPNWRCVGDDSETT